MGNVKTCLKCGKSMDEEKQFYKRRDGSRVDLCKKCLTMHVDNFNPETFTWILKDMDYPYVPSEWNTIRNKEAAKDPNLNGMSVLGKYLSKMKLKQWDGIGWEESEKIQAQQEAERRARAAQQEQYEESLKLQYENGEITEAQYKTLVSAETQDKEAAFAIPDPMSVDNPFEDPSQYIDESQLVDLGADLTNEDKVYLAMKWGRYYKPDEWIQLEKFYNEMSDSFDIHDADTIATLILICKNNLKMNQAIDSNDYENYQKLSKTSNDLRKSAKFTAAQKKEQEDNYVDSVGELITMCERQGFIPRFATDVPQDKVDITLNDMKNYVKKLVTQDLGFGQQIEDAIKKIQIQQEMEKDAEIDRELDDNDFEEYYTEMEAQKIEDSLTSGEDDV